LASVVFGLCLYFFVSPEVSQEFFAGWLLEQSLSVDNVLVFLLLFDYFKVPLENQDRVLKYGIIGAMIMRAVMIGLGSVALHHFQPVQLIFAGILIYSSASVLLSKLYNTLGGYDIANSNEEDMSKNQVVRLSRQLFNVTDKFDGDNFFVFIDGKRKATPLLIEICMVSIELSDVIFAVDSVPAVFGVTNNPLVVYSSNIFAIVGLRSMYIILSKAASDLEYLEPAVAFVVGFIGLKFVCDYLNHRISIQISLIVVVSIISIGVILSFWSQNRRLKNKMQQ
jgi:TerC family integral membrane protein